MATKEKKDDASKVASLINFKLLGIFFIRYFDLVVFLLVIIVFSASFLFILKPKYAELEEMSQNLEKKQKEEESLKNYLVKLQEYRDVYDGISAESKDRVNKILPDHDFREEFFIIIDSLISRQGLVLKELAINQSDFQEYDESSPKKGSAKSDSAVLKEVNEIKLDLLVSGTDYKSFKKLIASLENNLRIMDITNLKFSPEKKTTSLSITTYYQK